MSERHAREGSRNEMRELALAGVLLALLVLTLL